MCLTRGMRLNSGLLFTPSYPSAQDGQLIELGKLPQVCSGTWVTVCTYIGSYLRGGDRDCGHPLWTEATVEATWLCGDSDTHIGRVHRCECRDFHGSKFRASQAAACSRF